jgi:hypothetical protein
MWTRIRTALGLGVLALGLAGFAATGAGQFSSNKPTVREPLAQDPFAAAQPPAKDTKEPLKTPEKVPAKGVEDDDVPYPSFPNQAVVRLEENGKIMIRQRASAMTAKLSADKQYTRYERQITVVGHAYDASDVSVFDMKGNRISEKDWKSKLKSDKLVLVSFDGKLPLPREMQLVKDDTLLFVIPHSFSAGYGDATIYEMVAGPNGTKYYQPRNAVAPAAPPYGYTPAYPPTTPAVPPTAKKAGTPEDD